MSGSTPRPNAAEGPLATLTRGRAVWIDAEGGSMFPTIRHGDVVRVAPLHRDPVIGEIVLAVVAGRWVLHRVRRRTPDGWQTQGDFRRRADRPVRRSAIVGVATARRRRGTVLNLSVPGPSTVGLRPFVPLMRLAARWLHR